MTSATSHADPRPSPHTGGWLPWLFPASVALVVIVWALLRQTEGFAVRQPDGRYEGDITHYVYWTRLVTLGGVQNAYSGTWPETYAVYPPVTLYGYQALGVIYRATQDASFDPDRAQSSLWLRGGIKLLAVAWHLAAAAAIWWLVRHAHGPRAGQIAGGVYALNPAALFDAAHWAQPDGAHGLFSALAIGLVSLGSPTLAGGAAGLAALAKPQAWAILPLLLLAGWRQGGAPLVGKAALAGGAVALIVLAPFLTSGRIGEFLSLPGVISTVMPAVTANAHNLWWLQLAPQGVEPIFTDDRARFLGPLSYRLVAASLVAAQFAFTYWLYWSRRVSLPEAAAMGALGWFLATTQAHENHLFFVLPLLALAWPGGPRRLPWVYTGLTATVMLNMALHDQLLLEAVGLGLHEPPVGGLRTANALANVVVFSVWSSLAVRRPANRSSPV